MSTKESTQETTPDSDPWDRLAEHRETLEMMVEEDVPWAHHAETLLEILDERGY